MGKSHSSVSLSWQCFHTGTCHSLLGAWSYLHVRVGPNIWPPFSSSNDIKWGGKKKKNRDRGTRTRQAFRIPKTRKAKTIQRKIGYLHLGPPILKPELDLARLKLQIPTQLISLLLIWMWALLKKPLSP